MRAPGPTWWLTALLVVCPLAVAQHVRTVASELIAPVSPAGASHDLRIGVHVFAGSRWAAPEIRAAVLDAAGLLAQCDVASTALLQELEAPRRFHFYSTRVSRDLLRDLPTSKPAVFFVEDNLNRPSFDAEAIGRANAATRPELTDTIWIAHGARDLGLTLAHELVHVLADSGAHSEAPNNLMRAETAPGNVVLSPAQCNSLRTRGEANGLLTPRVLKP